MQIFRSVRYLLYCSAMASVAMVLQPEAANAADSCEIPQDWISDGIPDPAVLAKGSDFGSFCDFHTWAWNAFLWSMEETGGVLRFETFPTQEETIAGSYTAGARDGTPVLKLRPGKSDHPIDSVAQAGTQGLLVAQNNRAVYYSQHVNPQMYNQIINDNWNTAEGLKSEDPDALFDVGNIEYKVAWAVVGDGFDVPGAYTRTAKIPLLETVEVNGVPTITVPADPSFASARVALIGFHVVGWVNEHSEAIWASFSPTGIAPVVPQDGSIKPTDPVSKTSTPFYAADTLLSDCNQTQVPLQTLDESTQKLGLATQVCQIYAQGTLTSDPQGNVQAIQQINDSAASVLPAGNPGRSYEEVGAVWSKPDSSMPDKLNTTFQDALVGSTVLSNPVIETFTQTDVAQDNCFACHNSLQFQPTDPTIPPLHASMLNLSHFLMQIYVDTYQSSN